MKAGSLILLCVLISGCKFIRGVGQDMTAIGRTLTKVSGTGSDRGHEDVSSTSQTFDQPYEDAAYADPSEPPQWASAT